MPEAPVLSSGVLRPRARLHPARATGKVEDVTSAVLSPPRRCRLMTGASLVVVVGWAAQ